MKHWFTERNLSNCSEKNLLPSLLTIFFSIFWWKYNLFTYCSCHIYFWGIHHTHSKGLAVTTAETFLSDWQKYRRKTLKPVGSWLGHKRVRSKMYSFNNMPENVITYFQW